MLRKLGLAAMACMALTLVAFAPSASAVNEPQQICTTNGLTKGVYPPSNPVQSYKGSFDLGFDPTTANAIAGVDGGALLCGTDTDPPGQGGTFYTNGTILFPGYVPLLPGSGTRPVCARQNPTVALCDINGNGAVDAWENITDRSYSGSSVSDIWCDSAACDLVNMEDNPNVTTDNYVTYQASGNARCTSGTPDTLVACFQAEAQIGPVACDADIVTRKAGSSYSMTIYKPGCAGSDQYPTYFYTIDNLHICQYAGDVEGNACDTTPPLTKPVQFNGNVGTWEFAVMAQMTDGSSRWAIAVDHWT